jgi:hypothetical protein
MDGDQRPALRERTCLRWRTPGPITTDIGWRRGYLPSVPESDAAANGPDVRRDDRRKLMRVFEAEQFRLLVIGEQFGIARP